MHTRAKTNKCFPSSMKFTKTPLSLAVTTIIAGVISPVAFAVDGPCSPVINTYTVTSSLGDSSAGTFLEAIALANVSTGCDQIEFNPSVTSIAIVSFNEDITDDLNIVGNGSDALTISDDADIAINSTSGDLYVSNLRIADSSQGIRKTFGSLTVENTVIDNNFNGIRATTVAEMTVRNSSIINNLFTSGISFSDVGTTSNLLIDRTNITNNTSTFRGGGLNIQLANNSNVTISNSTFSGNTSGSHGAGIYIDDNAANATVTIKQTTISNNTASSGISTGGGIHYDSGGATSGSLTISNSSIIGNNASASGGGIAHAGTNNSINIDHTVIAKNTTTSGTQPNLTGVFDTLDYGWTGQNDLGPNITTVTNSFINADESTLLLGDLADNGGTTLTHLPEVGSPLIGAGNAAIAGLSATDQRQSTRIVDTIDIGAVERKGVPAIDTTSIVSSLTIEVNKEVNIDISSITTDNNVTFNVTGLPNGLSFDETTATISGTATETGTSELTITASNGEHEVAETIDLVVKGRSGSSALSYVWLLLLTGFAFRKKHH